MSKPHFQKRKQQGNPISTLSICETERKTASFPFSFFSRKWTNCKRAREREKFKRERERVRVRERERGKFELSVLFVCLFLLFRSFHLSYFDCKRNVDTDNPFSLVSVCLVQTNFDYAHAAIAESWVGIKR